MKFKDPFERSDLSVRKRLERIEVGYHCRARKEPPYWHFRTLEAKRWSVKAEAEAKALALDLMRESAARFEAIANEALKAQRELLADCVKIEAGLKDWSA